MVSISYRSREKAEDTLKIFRLIRTESIEEALQIIGISRIPHTRDELSNAFTLLKAQIVLDQPHVYSGESHEDLYKVIPINGHYVSARSLLWKWAAAALYAGGLGENIPEAVGYMFGIRETANRFSDDLFIMGSCLFFATGMALLTIDRAASVISHPHWMTFDPRGNKHTERTYRISDMLFQLITMIAADANIEKIQQAAKIVDTYTGKILRLEMWADKRREKIPV